MNIVFWHWWILAGILLILELLAPTAFFLWLGISAGMMGLLLMVMGGMNLEVQLVLFAVFAVISTILWRRFRDRNPLPSDQPTLNRRGAQYIGRTFTLKEAIVNGVGKIEVDDSSWRVTGPDQPEGTRVQVIGLDGVVFRVQPVDDSSQPI